MSDYYEITCKDVGRRYLKAFGRSWHVVDFMGEIQARDAGKRVYLRDGILQVENDEQLQARTRVWENAISVHITLHIRACVEESKVMRKINELVANATTNDSVTGEWTKAERWTIERE